MQYLVFVQIFVRREGHSEPLPTGAFLRSDRLFQSNGTLAFFCSGLFRCAIKLGGNQAAMYFKQFYLGCLAHASYLIGSETEAVVVDPQRDVDQYIAEAEARRFKISYIIETHLHADFVSGHLELAARTGAEIVFGEKARATFPHRGAKDG